MQTYSKNWYSEYYSLKLIFTVTWHSISIWTFFNKEARKIFLAGLPEDMVNRARGWALWKALITYDDVKEDFQKNARYTVSAILQED